MKFRISYVDCTPFYTSKRVDQLMNEVETIYTNVLESGNRTKAMQRLRLPPLEEKQPRIVTFRLGIFIGKILFSDYFLSSQKYPNSTVEHKHISILQIRNISKN